MVSEIATDKQLFALIDTAELTKCRSVKCASLSLPVKWDSTLPDLEQIVRVTGQVKESDGKLFFEAQSVNVVAASDESPQ